MSDTTPLPDELDELVSAYLDGVASADERARVEADPELLGRVETLRGVVGRLAGPVPVPDGDRERILAAALAAFDPAPTAPVHQLAPRRRRLPRWGTLIGAAAASAALVGGGVLALTGGSGVNTAADVATTAAARTAPVAKQAPPDSPAPTTAGDAPTPFSTESAPPELTSAMAEIATADAAPGGPALASVADLPALVATLESANSGTSGGSPRFADPCPAQAGDPVLDVTWQGQAALLYALPGRSAIGSDELTVEVVDASTCAVLATWPEP